MRGPAPILRHLRGGLVSAVSRQGSLWVRSPLFRVLTGIQMKQVGELDLVCSSFKWPFLPRGFRVRGNQSRGFFLLAQVYDTVQTWPWDRGRVAFEGLPDLTFAHEAGGIAIARALEQAEQASWPPSWATLGTSLTKPALSREAQYESLPFWPPHR